VLLKLGTVYYIWGEHLGVPQKQASLQWLQALKQNPTNAEVFYSLAVFYYFSPDQQDIPKAVKCLEKATMIQPDLEDAGLLLFNILTLQRQHTF
jgi:tetratricopeptide (TPR) repeat protein